MLHIILGRSGRGKTTRVLEALCHRGAERPQVLLVPEQQSHQVERALCALGGNGVSCYAEVLSFTRLANRIFMAGGGLGREELDGGGRILLMHAAVRGVSAQLTALGRAALRPAFLTGLLATVDELKSCCILPQTLMEAGAQMEGPEGDKLRDLALIAAAYDGQVAQVALDPRDRLTRATETLKKCQWGGGQDFWLDGFTDFTPQQMEMIATLLGQGERVTVTLTCDGLDGEEDIFASARRTAQRLLQLAKKVHQGVEVDYLDSPLPCRTPPLCHLEQHLFGTLQPWGEELEGEIALFSALTPRGEVEWTAAQILKLVQEEGYRFRDIAVVARNFQSYSQLIASIFPRYGVPVFCSAMTDILEKPVMALCTAALDAVAGGYQYEDVFRYLKTGLTDLPQEDMDLLENYVLKWNPRSSQWTGRDGFTLHPRGYGLPLEEGDSALLERLNGARATVVEPLERLRKNREKTGAGQARALYDFMEEIGLRHCLEERMDRLRQGGELTLADEYRQLWAILCGGLEQCATLLGDSPMELEEFSALLRLVLSQYDVGSIPVSLDRVMAGETTRQTNHRVKALFLLGAEDGSIPMVTGETGLLSDDDRSLLASYGLELNQSGEERLFREMTTVYEVCAQPSHHLYITWPRQGAGGEERRPAFLVERLELLYPTLRVMGEEASGGTFRLAAPLPALEQAGKIPQVAQALGQLSQYRDQVERLARASRVERGRLSRPVVDGLYGRRVPLSASRMDKYNSCHFSYFMQYGLKAQARRPGGFDAPEYGTFVHYVLEQVLGDDSWKNRTPGEDGSLTQEETALLNTLVDGAVARYVEEELGGLEGQTDRFRYLFHRLQRGVRSVVYNAAQELAVSKFQPISFELGFASGGDLPPVELTVEDMTVSISGFVDRVDGWVKDNRLYLRVVDYKTGRKSFDLTEVWNGLGLQMLLYLFTLEERGEGLYGLPVEGAGVLYLPARDVAVQGSRTMAEEARQRLVDRELIRSGVVLDDPAVIEAMESPQGGSYRFLPLKISKKGGEVTGDALLTAERFGKLQRHIQRVLQDICGELAAGNITADPYWRGPDKNACRYCDYADACQFEEGRGGDCKRYFATVKSDEFWSKLDKEQKNHDTE